MNSNTYIIDRIEGDFAVVLLNDSEINISRDLLPDDVQEGGRIGLVYHPPDTDTLSRASERLERLKKRDSGQQSIDL